VVDTRPFEEVLPGQSPVDPGPDRLDVVAASRLRFAHVSKIQLRI